jgi:hypothetical protein
MAGGRHVGLGVYLRVYLYNQQVTDTEDDSSEEADTRVA